MKRYLKLIRSAGVALFFLLGLITTVLAQDQPAPYGVQTVLPATVSEPTIWKGVPVTTGAHFEGQIIIGHSELDSDGNKTGQYAAFACSATALRSGLILSALHCAGWNKLGSQSFLQSWNHPLAKYYPQEVVEFFVNFGGYTPQEFDIHPEIGWVHIIWDGVDNKGGQTIDLMVLVPTQAGLSAMDETRPDFDFIDVIPLTATYSTVNTYGFGMVEPGGIEGLNMTGPLPFRHWNNPTCITVPENFACSGTEGHEGTTAASGDSGGGGSTIINGVEYIATVTSRSTLGVQPFLSVDLQHPLVRAKLDEIINQELSLPRPTKPFSLRNSPQFFATTSANIITTTINSGSLSLNAGVEVITTSFGAQLLPSRVAIGFNAQESCLSFSTEPIHFFGTSVSWAGNSGLVQVIQREEMSPIVQFGVSIKSDFAGHSCFSNDPRNSTIVTTVVTTTASVVADLLDSNGRGDMPFISNTGSNTSTISLKAKSSVTLPISDPQIFSGERFAFFDRSDLDLQIYAQRIGRDLIIDSDDLLPGGSIIFTSTFTGSIEVFADENGVIHYTFADIYQQMFLPLITR